MNEGSAYFNYCNNTPKSCGIHSPPSADRLSNTFVQCSSITPPRVVCPTQIDRSIVSDLLVFTLETGAPPGAINPLPAEQFVLLERLISFSVVRLSLNRSVEFWEETDFDFTVGQCLATDENNACKFLSDTTQCPMVTSKSVVRQCLIVDRGVRRG